MLTKGVKLKSDDFDANLEKEVKMEKTIVAISTASGNGGIGIIRLSGRQTFDIIDKIFIPKNKSKDIKGYTMKYGNIVNPKNNEIIDEVLVSYFVAPKSYTTENMCEINSHGGTVVEKRILELCLENGAELAEPGEFTKRAFLNGRIDLSQAEGIIDLINSKTEMEAKESINQLEGNLSKKIKNIEQKMLDIMVNIEVTIDYPEYDVEEVTNSEALKKLNEIHNLLNELENSFNKGKIIKDGIKTVIIGKPNAGKSSLLNSLLKEDRAIVSDIAGTTRDTIEEYLNIDGISLKLIDTAGIRDTENTIEKIGVEKSKKLVNDADLIIAIFDISGSLDEDDRKIIELIRNKKAIILLNKVDVLKNNNKMEEEIKKLNKPVIKISAKEEIGFENLYSEIKEMFELNEISSNNEILITNERHKNQIIKAKQNILNAIETVKNNTPVDIISIYINQAMEDLGEITGVNVSENIINEIFAKFCLGK